MTTRECDLCQESSNCTDDGKNLCSPHDGPCIVQCTELHKTKVGLSRCPNYVCKNDDSCSATCICGDIVCTTCFDYSGGECASCEVVLCINCFNQCCVCGSCFCDDCIDGKCASAFVCKDCVSEEMMSKLCASSVKEAIECAPPGVTVFGYSAATTEKMLEVLNKAASKDGTQLQNDPETTKKLLC